MIYSMRKLITFTILLTILLIPTADADLSITVKYDQGWGNASTSNIKALCENVALHFQEQLRDEHKIRGDLTVVHHEYPVAFYRTFFGGNLDEYKVGLSVSGTYWSQFAYQFGHEFCHVLHNHDDMKNSQNYWFNEAICELATVWVLLEMGETWETRAPYPNWVNYRHNLTNYAQNLVDRAEAQYTGTAAEWLDKWENDMRNKTPDVFSYPRITQLSYKFLDIFQENPEAWNAIRQMPTSNSEMATYMKEWYEAVDTEDKEFVKAIADEMGIEVTTPTDILTANSDITYLTFFSGDQPVPNEFGLSPKNPKNEWNHWADVIENRTNNNRDITIDGTEYDQGISVVPGDFQDAVITYDLTGADYMMFQGYVGLADEHDHIIKPNSVDSCHLGGSAIFTFEIDGIEMFNSGVLDGSDAPMLVEFEIPTDATELKIIINNAGDGKNCDAAAIGNAKLLHSSILTQPSDTSDSVAIDADVNNDGYVDLFDVLIVRSGMNAETSYDTDVNDDGKTDEVDLLIVKALAIEAIAKAAPSKRKVNITTWGSMKTR